MANTVYHYSPTSWVNGTTPANATNMNHLETGPLDALSGLNPDLFTAFVYSGIVCTKDGMTANQLDIASGRAYLTQTDGTLALIVVASDNTHTTATPSTTYHLYLQPDGTWYWSTSNSPAANSLAICSVTTDGSGNINVVTDLRTGGPGVPSIVAKAIHVHVTVNTNQVILSYTPPVTGLYRISLRTFATVISPAPKFSVLYSYTDPDDGSQTEVPYTVGQGASPPAMSSLTGVANAGYSTIPNVIYASTSAPIQVNYLNSASSVSDFVSAFIERLA